MPDAKKYGVTLLISLFFFSSSYAQTLPVDTDWFTLGANYQRTSWVREEVRGPFNPDWYRPIDPYIDNTVQVIAANNTLFISTSKGLYAFDSTNGDQKWVYGTEMPLSNSPTVVTINGKLTAYVGGYNRRILAIDANTGQALSGYAPYEAGAGFDTNPLVINDTIYAGNRDGYFYALNAIDGSLRWRFQTGGPVHYNAAYKEGMIYFASDDAYAYALNASTGAQVWKSGKFPGVGFDMYWPVIYTEPVSGKDYVIFSGSLKDNQFINNGAQNHAQANVEMYDIYGSWPESCRYAGFSRDPICLAGPIGNEPYVWAIGTSTLRAGRIYDYYNNNPGRWNGQPPYLRITYVLDRGTGTEVTPYAPFNPSQSDGGAQGYKHPPIVGSDGVLYTAIGYYGGGNGGCHGGISGWKFGTPYISRLYDHDSGQCDEPETFSAGGNIIYVGEGVNALIHGTFGAVEYSKPMGSNAHWGVNLNIYAQGATTKYTNISLQGKFGGNSGVYTYFDGVLNHTLIPYKGKIYAIIGNVLYSFSATGRASTPLPTAVAPSSQLSFSVVDTPSSVLQRLESEVQKMVNAGHLRPGFMDSGQQTQFMVGAYVNPVPNEHMVEYFHNPSETVAALARTLPYLSSGLQDQVKTYLQTNYGPSTPYDLTKIVNVGWKDGAKREAFDDTPDMTNFFNKPYDDNGWASGYPRAFSHNYDRNLQINTNDSGRWYQGGMTVDSFYGAWKYAEIFPESALTIFNAMKDHLSVADQAGVNNDMTDANFITYPWLLNEYLIGYYGYLQLEKLAGVTTDITASSRYAEYNRLLTLRLNNFTKDPPWDGTSYNHNNDLNAVRNFIYLTPELADIFRTNKLTEVQATLNQYDVLTPFWFVSKYHRSYSESYYQPLMDYAYLFQARALISRPSFSELVKYMDIPAFAVGDLFYIQNLAAALSAALADPSSSAADVNNDTQVNILDVQACVNHILGIQEQGSRADVDGDGSVNVLDVQAIVNIILGV